MVLYVGGGVSFIYSFAYTLALLGGTCKMGNSESRRDAAVGAGFVAGGLYGAATGGIPSVGAGMVVGSIFGPLGTAIGGGIGWLVGGGAGMAVGGYIGAESVEAIMGEPKKEPERNQEKEPERKPEEEPEEETPEYIQADVQS